MALVKLPKSFGCFSQKGLLLKLSSFGSKSSNTTSNSSSPTLMSPRSPKPSTNNQEQGFRQVFARFDADNDGKISAFELRAYFGSIGEYMSHQEAQGVIDDLDKDGDGFVNFEEFMRLVKGEDENEDVKAAFEMFENEKGCGEISPKSLQKALSRLGDSKSYEECLEMIKVFDTHGKGGVDFNEFRKMMMV